MKEILLTQGKVALLDDKDYEWLSEWKWHVRFDPHGNYYAKRNITIGKGRQTTIHMHRVILGVTDKQIVVDHIDRNGLNNMRANLRLATYGQNQQNVPRTQRNTSGYKGAFFHKRIGRWHSIIGVDGKHHHLGYFDTPEEAARAYDSAARELHGEFACCNFPQLVRIEAYEVEGETR